MELIKGKYYTGYWGSSESSRVPFLYAGDLNKETIYMDINGKYGFGVCNTSYGIEFEEPTPEELDKLLNHPERHRVAELLKEEFKFML